MVFYYFKVYVAEKDFSMQQVPFVNDKLNAVSADRQLNLSFVRWRDDEVNIRLFDSQSLHLAIQTLGLIYTVGWEWLGHVWLRIVNTKWNPPERSGESWDATEKGEADDDEEEG